MLNLDQKHRIVNTVKTRRVTEQCNISPIFIPFSGHKNGGTVSSTLLLATKFKTRLIVFRYNHSITLTSHTSGFHSFAPCLVGLTTLVPGSSQLVTTVTVIDTPLTKLGAVWIFGAVCGQYSAVCWFLNTGTV